MNKSSAGPNLMLISPMINLSRILVSGFEPFLDIAINPTELLMKKLSREHGLNTIVLPVDFKSAFLVLENKIDELKPDIVIATGVAADRQQPELERIAINHQSAVNSDNSGFIPMNNKIDPNGPDGIFCNFNVDIIRKVPASGRGCTAPRKSASELDNPLTTGIKVSNSAGTYVCNTLMYQLLQKANRDKFLAGFLHIPNLTDDESIDKFKLILLHIIDEIIEQAHRR